MKKYYLLLLLVISIFSLQAQQKKVVASASIFADMAAVISGGNVQIETIVPIGGDPHLHEPTPRDAQLVADADLILKNGLTFEGWLNELIANSGTKAKEILITKGIQPIESQYYKGSSDPHAWMSAKNGLIYIENIKNALVELDPDHADEYEFNYNLYRQQLEDLDKFILEKVQALPKNRRYLITSHDAFQYYGRRYGIKLESILGTSTDAEARTSDVLRLSRVIKENDIPAVFIESTVNPKLLQQLATDNDIEIGGKLFADSIGDENSPAPSYIDMLKYNTETIVNALGKTRAANETPSETPAGNNYLMWGVLAFLLIGGFIFVAKKV